MGNPRRWSVTFWLAHEPYLMEDSPDWAVLEEKATAKRGSPTSDTGVLQGGHMPPPSALW